MPENVELNFLLDAVRAYSKDYTLHSDSNPYRLSLNGQLYSIHVGLIHDSGNNRARTDESRIQLSRSSRLIQESRKSNHTLLFIGFFSTSNNQHPDNIAKYDGAAFSAWRPDYALSKNDAVTGALYGRFSHESITLDLGAVVYKFKSQLLNQSINTISMRSTDLGFYMENHNHLHFVKSSKELQSVISSVESYLALPDPGVAVTSEVTIGGHGKKVTITRTAYPRDPKFSQEVLEAYGHRCAICKRQLALIQAAHIIPHNQDDCPNHVSNGIALCIEHHKMYDDALLLPGRDGQLHLNPARVEHLENINQTAGLDGVKALVAKGYRVPDDAACHPNGNYLERGLDIRLGKGG